MIGSVLMPFDPPSFSNSKRMDNTLDIQRDHLNLIDTTLRLLADKGVLYFSALGESHEFLYDARVLERFEREVEVRFEEAIAAES